MKRIITLLAMAMVLAALPVAAQSLEVTEGVITTQVVERAPVDEIQSYSASVGKLYCFTRLAGAEGETSITHVWYRNDKEMARITLPVRFTHWRTWSSKTILPEWTGDWRVEILDAKGNLLKAIPFQLL